MESTGAGRDHVETSRSKPRKGVTAAPPGREEAPDPESGLSLDVLVRIWSQRGNLPHRMAAWAAGVSERGGFRTLTDPGFNPSSAPYLSVTLNLSLAFSESQLLTSGNK